MSAHKPIPRPTPPRTRSGKPKRTPTTTLSTFDLKNGQPISLNPGEYHVDEPDEVFLQLTGASVYSSVLLEQPLHPAYWSEINQVRFVPNGPFAAFVLDRSARVGTYKVTIDSRKEYKQHIGEKNWEYAEHEGTGLQVTGANDGDNSWMCNWLYPTFSFLEYGIKADLPDMIGKKQPGTLQWQFVSPTFNSVMYPFYMRRCAEWLVLGGMAQLAKTVIDVDGNANAWEHFHIERSATHIIESAESLGNSFYTDADVRLCTLLGVHRRWRRMWNKNISNTGGAEEL
ncbi:MAG: hypothetical protein H0U60_02450 [Blastocatellia bacterium]|nr:hypothetical protein [Blastocatellia bacterium]